MPHTPGPWRWEAYPKQHTVHLTGGRPTFDKVVMCLGRWGMNGAVPLFCDGEDWLEKAEKWFVPIAGQAHHEWIRSIDHPDALLIAAAPELLEALKLCAKVIQNLEVHNWPPGWDLKKQALIAAKTAIAKAEGAA